jgi:hypothetical protein
MAEWIVVLLLLNNNKINVSQEKIFKDTHFDLSFKINKDDIIDILIFNNIYSLNDYDVIFHTLNKKYGKNHYSIKQVKKDPSYLKEIEYKKYQEYYLSCFENYEYERERHFRKYIDNDLKNKILMKR